jgi:hypothetical protein
MMRNEGANRSPPLAWIKSPGRRRVSFKMRAQRLAALHFVQEVKQGTLAEGV